MKWISEFALLLACNASKRNTITRKFYVENVFWEGGASISVILIWWGNNDDVNGFKVAGLSSLIDTHEPEDRLITEIEVGSGF